MPDLTKGHTFNTGDVVTAANLNSLLDGAEINDNAVTADMIAANAITDASISSSAGIEIAKLQGPSDGKIIVGRASDGAAAIVSVGGDVTLANNVDGVTADLTIADDAITADKIIAGAVTGPKIAMTSDARGDILIRGAANYERLAKPGSPAGEVLTFAESATDPAWVAPAAHTHALNFEQIRLTGIQVILNSTGQTPAPVSGSGNTTDSWWLVSDSNDDDMQSTSAFTITAGSKVRISVSLWTDNNHTNTATVALLQRSVDAGVSWTDLAVGDMPDPAGSFVQVSMQMTCGHGYRGIENGTLDYIDTPLEPDPLYRVLWSCYPSYSAYLNRDMNDDTDYRVASSMIVEEIPIV